MSGSATGMKHSDFYGDLSEALAGFGTARAIGRVTSARGGEVEVEGLALPVGGSARVRRADGSTIEGEVIGVSETRVRVRLFESGSGLAVGAEVEFGHRSPLVTISRALMGRAIDALCRPADGLGAFPGAVPVALAGSSVRTSQGTRTLIVGATREERIEALVRAAVDHEGPVVALLVGGSETCGWRFVKMLGAAAARTVRVVEPGHPPRARAWRAARVAGTLAGFLSEAEAAPALVVAEWRVPVTTPAGLALHGSSESIWSLGGAARAREGDFDRVIDVAAKREVA